jgi:ABC-type dipeptide/oligopeptide/nickel transport system permease subunit
MPFFCRIGSATLVVLGVCTLVFLPIHLVPGDPGEAMLVAPHLVLALGLAILLVVLSVNLVGDAMRDRLDVRLARS